MTSLRKKITAAFIATALIVPTTASIASAQSSFISGSSSSSDTPNTPSQDSKAKQLKKAVEQTLIANGQIKSRAAEASANALVDRALNYELIYIENFYENVESSPASYGFVLRIPVTEIDTVLANIPDEFEDTPSEISAPFGVAIGKDADFYYLSVLLLVG